MESNILDLVRNNENTRFTVMRVDEYDEQREQYHNQIEEFAKDSYLSDNFYTIEAKANAIGFDENDFVHTMYNKDGDVFYWFSQTSNLVDALDELMNYVITYNDNKGWYDVMLFHQANNVLLADLDLHTEHNKIRWSEHSMNMVKIFFEVDLQTLKHIYERQDNFQ
ncbi:hypothetical protein BPT24_055 [Tenacibaculum phage pT24]|uniref:Uncharacterized protein n=1 Tax=Tenacibaculum phage pT24 TaxID=1880590 RepID=A0A1B4XWI4_9CAUD|nr:hypothetical protein HYP10_gp055 [Tenacibaculum phage pT24]BAV39178.1 hypothetical protein BPT24_055 [Tenacibaculum phage pT24]